MISTQTLIAILGLSGGFTGIASSCLMTLAATRTSSDERAQTALAIIQQLALDRKPGADGQGKGPTPEEAARIIADVDKALAEEILRKSKENRRDMKWGGVLLFLTFAFLIAQSIATFWSGPPVQ